MLGFFVEQTMKKAMQLLSVATLLVGAPTLVQASVIETLQQQEPMLYRLYEEYKSVVPTLTNYINSQGFKLPVENVAGVAHELIHIASAAHFGYYIEGTYYEPYLNQSKWTNIRNADITKNIRSEERSNISELLVRPNPKNGLGSILDEINAYTHVLLFVCRNEPGSTNKQISNIDGLLKIVEVYLRTIRIEAPNQYINLLNDRESSGAIETIMQRAWLKLRECDTSRNYIYPEATNFVNESVSIKLRKKSIAR
jgi:hypothetical protein